MNLYKLAFGLIFFILPLALFSQDPYTPVEDLDPMVVTGNVAPTKSSEVISPVTILTGDDLVRIRSNSLGETLNGSLGIHGTAFGAGASRPVIRGFEGPRVRILESGVESMDVSDTSPDHAVSLEPFFTESIEVVRGPSTLLYGSSAVGGVVNLIDNRIPRDNSIAPVSGGVEGRYHTVSEGYDMMGRFNYTEPNWAIGITGLTRDHKDYDIPGFAESVYQMEAEEAEHDEDEDHDEGEEHEHEAEEEVFGTLENSFVKTETSSVAFSWFPSEGQQVSLGYFMMDSQYGVPGHAHHHHEDEHGDEDHDEGEHDEDEDHHDEDEHGDEEEEMVTIDLEQRKWDVEGAFTFSEGFLETVNFRFAHSDYIHTEFEGDEEGTVFERTGWEARLEAGHRFSETVRGVAGIQYIDSDFSAEGFEAFVPPSETRDFGIFVLEEWTLGDFRPQAGIRWEQRDITANTGQEYDGSALSYSLGTFIPLGSYWNAGVTFARSERHPTATELFADGPHAATRQYEIGDPNLGKEKSNGVDAVLRHLGEVFSGQVSVFYNQFEDYINLAPTGGEEDELPVFQFEAVDARFYGAEVQATWHAYHSPESSLDFTALFDMTRAENTTDDVDLPKIPPARLGARGRYSVGGFTVGTTLRYSFEQEDLAPFELPTDAFTEWNADIGYSFIWDGAQMTAFIRADNILDEEIRFHTSAIKDLAPRPGRNFSFGFSAQF